MECPLADAIDSAAEYVPFSEVFDLGVFSGSQMILASLSDASLSSTSATSVIKQDPFLCG